MGIMKQVSWESKTDTNIYYSTILSLYANTEKKTNIIKKYIGQGLPELTPVENVGCEVDEAGSPLALDNG